MPSVEITGIDKALKMLTDLPANSRKAASKAVNDTLREVQSETGEKILPDAFTLRGRGKQWWEPGQRYGFNIRYSNPSTLEGTLGSQAPWLKEQEQGGERQRGTNLAIPASDYKGKTEIMRKQLKPRAITKKKDVFFAKLHSGLVGIFQRHGSEPMKLLFSIKQRAHYSPILHFEKKAGESAEKRFSAKFAIRFLEIFK